MSFTDEILRLQHTAQETPLGHRSAKHALYALLGECMDLAHRAMKDSREQMELRQLIRADNRHNKKGRWIEKDSDSYLLVCRFVFYDPKRASSERTTGWRYATVLREAAARQVRPSELADWLKANGGMNTLVKARPGQEERRVQTAKVIYLTQSIDLPITGDPFTLALRYDRASGRFEPVT